MMSEGAGRPTTYTQEMATLICARMAEGESLRSICRDKTTPAMSTVFLWVSKHKEFSEQYKLAMASRADAMFEEMFEIADDGQNDWIESHEGADRLNSENIQRSRLRIDTRKWALSKMMPKKYSDKSSSDTSEIDIQIKLLELQKLQREVNPPKVNAPDDDYKLPLTPDEPIPDDPIL